MYVFNGLLYHKSILVGLINPPIVSKNNSRIAYKYLLLAGVVLMAKLDSFILLYRGVLPFNLN